jgi:hypothetical protein
MHVFVCVCMCMCLGEIMKCHALVFTIVNIPWICVCVYIHMCVCFFVVR